MKKFLLSLFCCLMAFTSIQAEEKTINVTFSAFTAGEQYAKNEEHKLSDELTIYTTQCHFTTELRIYSSETHNGFVVSNKLPGTITKMTFNAGNKKDNLVVYGSNDGKDWKEVGKISTTTTAYIDYTLDFSNTSYTYFKLDVEGTEQIRLKSMSVTYTVENGGDSGETPSVPEAPSAPTLPASCNFDNSMTVEITDITEGATVYYTTNGDDPTENSTLYKAPFTVNETTTVKAIAVNEAGSSEIAEAIYTKNVTEEPETPENATATFTAADKYTENTVLTDVNIELDNSITATFAKPGGTAPQYYTKGTAVRWYAKNTLTITSTAGNISKIVLTFGSDDGSNTIATNVGTFENNTWSGTAKSITFTVDGTTGHRRISAIEVTYSTNANEEEVENVNAPVISTESTEYIIGEEIEVEITTATEGATIYYTLDGNTPTTSSEIYSDPIKLSATTTVKAFAVKENCNNSPIVEKTFTFKNRITLENASVAEVIAAYNPEINIITKKATVIGYIVGTAKNNTTEFGNTNPVATNLIIADSPEEDNLENCIVVELPDNKIRAALNLVNNPGNYKRKVILTGNVEEYFKKAGLTSTSAYGFIVEPKVDAEWATYYAPIDIAIPEGMEAYIATGVNNGSVTLKQIAGTIPANTGVLLKSGNTSTSATTDDVSENLLQGSATNIYVTEEAYVLSKVDGVIGFYKAAMNQQDGTAWLNTANKAYLPASAIAAAEGVSFYGFRFDDEETTGIEEVETEESNVKVIYDLSGRRISKITAPGIYIIGGRKVLIK